MDIYKIKNEVAPEDWPEFAELKWLYTDVHLLEHEERLSELGAKLDYFSKKYGACFIREFEQAMKAHF